MPAYIQSIGKATPQFRFDQQDLVQFMVKTNSNGIDENRMKALYRATGIRHRYSVLPDYGRSSSEYIFYPDDDRLEPFPDTAMRMELYQKEAAGLCAMAITDCFQNTDLQPSDITHLITVSCTGFYAPGIDIDLINLLGMNPYIKRTAINYMGCYAALNAIRTAKDTVLANPDSHVLVVCVELCSIHFQKNDSEDAILANALFGDGAAAVIVSPEPTSGVNFSIQRSHSHIIPDGHDDMAWSVGNLGFEMKLSTYVPDLLRRGLREIPKDFPEINNADYYAIHPGGVKILDAIGAELGLTRDALSFSFEILRNFGNMSSPTVLFVLSRLKETLRAKDQGSSVVSMAFGPGLSIEVLTLSVQHIP